MSKKARGFTIVELLIVIVIIAILAAITIVAYNGIQQRANNAAVVDAASKIARMSQAYIAQEDNYPLPGPSTRVICVTTDKGCHDGTMARVANATFDSNIAQVGQVPRSIPTIGDSYYGIMLSYWGSAGIGPFYMTYYLQGTSQQCGMGGVLDASVSAYSTTGYTVSNVGGSGKTRCIVYVPGPAHTP